MPPISNQAPTAVRLTAATPVANAAAAVAENAAGAVIGSLSTLDPNAGDTFTYTVSDSRFEVVGSTLKLKAGVALNFEVQRFLTVTVTARDQGGLTKAQAFGLAVTDVNDAPTAVRLSATTVAENAAGAAIGTLTTIDPDAGNTHSYTVSDSRFEVVGNTLKLKAGEALDFEAASRVTLTVTSTDQGGLSRAQSFTLRVTDANDAATVGGTLTGTLSEDGPAITGTASVTDPDAGQSAFQAQASLAGAYGSLSISAAGAWSYAVDPANAAAQALKAGESLTDTVTIRSVDGTTGSVTVTITGANDVASIGGATTGTVTEDTALPATGTLIVTDPDAGEARFQAPASLAGTYGTFQFNATTGAWKYFLATDTAAVQALDDGDTLTDTLTVTSLDGTATQAITVTIAGANDGPTITSGAGTAAPYELAGSYLGSQVRGFLQSQPTLADLDGDGRTDIVITSPVTGKYGFRAFQNTPDGFQPFATDPLSGVATGRLAAADLDGDGRTDLAVLSGSGLQAFRNTATGFESFATNPFEGLNLGGYDSVALGDLDGDGRVDVLASNDAALQAWRDTGSGFEAFATSSLSGIDVGSVSGTALIDLDGDGRLDLVVGAEQVGIPAKYGQPGAALLAFRNTGSGFEAFPTNPLGNLPRDKAFALGDLDGDGRADIAVSTGSGDFATYSNTGSGFEAAASDPLAGVPGDDVFALGDLDGDGLQDLAVQTDTGFVGYRNTGSGFEAFASNPLADQPADTVFQLGDLDGDGRADLTVRTDTGLAGYRNTGSGFEAFATDPLDGLSSEAFFALGDIDGDGLADLVASTELNLVAYRNTGSGFVPFAGNLLAGLPPVPKINQIALSDMDGDGKADLLLNVDRNTGGSGLPDQLMLAYQNTGTGFERLDSGPIPQDLGILFAAPTAGDLDGDGTPDLVVGNKYGGLSSFQVAGGGLVSLDTGNPLAGAYGFPQAVDLDGDGRLDVSLDRFAGIKYSATTTAYQNTGSGFAPFDADPFARIAAPFGDARYVDLDGDGDLDAAASSKYTNNVQINFENTGSGFVPFAGNPLDGTTLGLDPYYGLAAIDIDGDGLLDLVGRTGDALVAARRTATGWEDFEGDRFFGVVTGDTLNAISPQFAYDLDGDGDQDLVTSTKYGQVVSLENVGGSFQTFATDPLSGAQVGFSGKPVLADIDGDGDKDILLGKAFTDLSVGPPLYRENNGGDFSTVRELGGITAGFSGRYTVLDVNDDGRPDVLTSSFYGPVNTYLNVGGGFQEGGTGIAYQATATDPEGDAITWTLDGTDAAAFAIDATTGAVTFAAAPDFEAPTDANGDNVYEFEVVASDGTASTSRLVKLFVANVNEAAVITGDSTGSVTEDGTLTASGTLVATDPDIGESRFQWPLEWDGDYGRFEFDARTGEWTYDLNNANAAVQALNDGETLADTLRVFSLDGTAFQDIVITIQGTNERAIATSAGLFHDENNNGIIDAGETAAVVFSGAGKNADLATQAWTIEFESRDSPVVDITGFSSDDKLALDFAEMFGASYPLIRDKSGWSFFTDPENNYLSASASNGTTYVYNSVNVYWEARNATGSFVVYAATEISGVRTNRNSVLGTWTTDNSVLQSVAFLPGPQFEFILPP